MINRLVLAAILLTAGSIPAFAQPSFTTKPADAPPPPANMSCDDQITNAEIRLQTVIDADKKAAALPHMNAAKAAIDKNDPATCKAEVQKALQVAS